MRADFLFLGRAGGESDSEQGTGREGHVFVPCQKHAALPSSVGTHTVSDKNCVRVEDGPVVQQVWSRSHPTPAYSSALGSDVYYTWLISAWKRREGDSCVSQTCDVEAKRLGHGQSPDERLGGGMSLGATLEFPE